MIEDPFSVSVVQNGFSPWVSRRVRPCPLPYRPPPAPLLQPMRSKVHDLLRQGIVQSAEQPFYQHGFFLIPKPRPGEFREILNCRRYNGAVVAPHFKMEGLHTLRQLVRPGDYAVSIDIQSAYPHVPLHPAFRRHFQFWAPDPGSGSPRLFEYTGLPFGLSSAPYVFSRLMRSVAAVLRRHGVRCVVYLDDILVLGSSLAECQAHSRATLFLLSSLGFVVHPVKSSGTIPSALMEPRQVGVEFLGFQLDLKAMLLRLPAQKRASLKQSVSFLQCSFSSALSPRQLAQSVGKLVAARFAVTGAMTHTRLLQRTLKLARQRAGWDQPCVRLAEQHWADGLRRDLNWWINALQSPTMGQLQLLRPDYSLDCDASPYGWGGFLGEQSTGGFFSPAERMLPQNQREMLGAVRTLQALVPTLPEPPRFGTRLLLQTDNMTVKAYLSKEGGPIPALNDQATALLQWLHNRNFTLRCVHLPGILNVRADRRSRVFLRSWSRARLSPSLLRNLQQRGRLPQFTLDAFADPQNTQCRRFFSAEPAIGSSGVNALWQRWPARGCIWAFPPFRVIPAVLSKLQRERVRLWLLAPDWSGAPWYPLLQQLRAGSPIFLPGDGFLSPMGEPLPAPRWRMAVWPLSAADY